LCSLLRYWVLLFTLVRVHRKVRILSRVKAKSRCPDKSIDETAAVTFVAASRISLQEGKSLIQQPKAAIAKLMRSGNNLARTSCFLIETSFKN
jgi:hypothetical protein